MTEQEAIENLRKVRYCYDCQCEMNDCVECDMTINMASTALKEIQQYRAIGTVEECREAVEKQTPKKPRIVGNAMICPLCVKCYKTDKGNYCDNCGQKMDWE